MISINIVKYVSLALIVVTTLQKIVLSSSITNVLVLLLPWVIVIKIFNHKKNKYIASTRAIVVTVILSFLLSYIAAANFTMKAIGLQIEVAPYMIMVLVAMLILQRLIHGTNR